jgi:hypothetical protein
MYKGISGKIYCNACSLLSISHIMYLKKREWENEGKEFNIEQFSSFTFKIIIKKFTVKQRKGKIEKEKIKNNTVCFLIENKQGLELGEPYIGGTSESNIQKKTDKPDTS